MSVQMDYSSEKIALISGASRGLGAAFAQALAPDYHIIALARTIGALDELDDRIKARGGTATLAPIDITDEAAMSQIGGSIMQRWGKLDLWVHAAIHAAPLSPSITIDAKDFAKSIDINVTACARLIGYLAPLLGAESKAVFFDDPRAGQPFFGSYGASKAAQIALARSWQAETQKTGPKVHICTPAPMPTATRARFFPGESRESLTPVRDEAARLISEVLG